MSLTILVEGSEILYRSAFAVEKLRYQVTCGNTTRTLRADIKRNRVYDIVEALNAKTGKEYLVSAFKEAEPVEYCLGLIKNKLNWMRALGQIRIFLSNPEKPNFRLGIAKTPGSNGLGYKAGRPAKPIHYQAARDYLLSQPECELLDHYEEDDGLSMNQSDSTVIASIDKDLNMVAGKHLNWVTGNRYIVPEGLGTIHYSKGKCQGMGMFQFYAQLLIGDLCDNIPGLTGIGHAKAYKLLKDCKEEQQAFDIVRDMYYTKLGETKETLNRLLEIADLLYMCRKYDGVVITGRHYLINRGFL